MKRYSGLAGWFVAAVVLVIGAGRSEEIRAKRLVIEDEQGRNRIVMEVADPKGNNVPVVRIKNAEGETRLLLWLGPKDAGSIIATNDDKEVHTLP